MYKRRPDLFSTSFNIGEKAQAESPYKNLEDSLPKNSTRTPTKVNHHGGEPISSSNKLKKEEFDRRLEQIKKKYISPAKGIRNTSTPMSSIDLNIPTHRVISRENSMIKEKEIQSRNTQQKISDFEGRKPTISENSFCSQFSKISTPTFEYSKRPSDDERIRSINKINERIKTMLELNEPKQEAPEKIQESVPELAEKVDETKYKKSIIVYQSAERVQDSRAKRLNKSYLDSYKDSQSLAQEFDNRMLQIQERIKKSEENRIKIMSNYQPIQTFTKTPRDNKKEDNRKEENKKERSSSVLYSHRYMDFGKNVSRNIIQQLKTFEKPNIPTQSTLSDRSTIKSQAKQKDDNKEPKTEIPRLISTLVTQIKLDQQARNGKACLQSNNDPSKWSKLRDILARRQGKYSEEQIKQMFTCSQGDHNPFYVCEPSESLENIVRKYIDSEEHWKSKVSRKFDVRKLKEEGFKNELLDLELKGYLQIEDLVRYLNIETGKFYRNRDLITIFKRITKINKINFQELMRNIEA